MSTAKAPEEEAGSNTRLTVSLATLVVTSACDDEEVVSYVANGIVALLNDSVELSVSDVEDDVVVVTAGTRGVREEEETEEEGSLASDELNVEEEMISLDTPLLEVARDDSDEDEADEGEAEERCSTDECETELLSTEEEEEAGEVSLEGDVEVVVGSASDTVTRVLELIELDS